MTYRLDKIECDRIDEIIHTYSGKERAHMLVLVIENLLIDKEVVHTPMIELYPKKINDPAKVFKEVVAKMLRIRMQNAGKESNGECIAIDQLIELLQKMKLADVRKLHLEKIITTKD